MPWQARHALAEAPTQAAYAIVIEFRGLAPDVAVDFAAASYGHLANSEYVHAVEQWAVAGLTDDELMTSIYGRPGYGRPGE